MINPKKEPARIPGQSRRRFICLVILVTVPILILAAIGARALHLEAMSARLEAVERATYLANWTSLQTAYLLFPGNNAWDAKTGYQNLLTGPMLHPSHPGDDFVVRMKDCEQLPDFRFQCCLLDQKGALIYPQVQDILPGTSIDKISAVGASASGWESVSKDHERSREIYGHFCASVGDPQTLTRSRVFNFLGMDVPYVAWRVQLGDSGYQVLVALPEVEFQKLLERMFDPKSRRLPSAGNFRSRPKFSEEQEKQLRDGKTVQSSPSLLQEMQAHLTGFPPIDDYMQMAIVEASMGRERWQPIEVNHDLLFRAGRENEPMVTSASQLGGSSSAGHGMGTFMKSSLLAISDSPLAGSSIGLGECSFVVRDDDKKGEFMFRAAVSVGDSGALLAQVRRHTWGLAFIIGISAVGACTALGAAWRTFQQQEQLNEMKSDFISSVSHELRAPLASIRLMAESLLRGVIRDPQKQAEYFRLLVQEGKRVSGLVENVLDFSRVERGRKEYTFESCDLSKLFNDTVDGLRPYAGDKQVRLELTEVGQPLAIDCDAVSVQQILVNLIDNAIKHSPPAEVVQTSLLFESGSVRFSVADRGPGIPPHDHKRIFEPFFRRGGELRRETQGVGLGLSIVQHAVVAHGGTITVESAPGKGSRFVVVLPAKQQANGSLPSLSTS